ncbi:MAG: bifunctional DNA primase/polymerase [Ktedonobacteraceae bacterium]
MVFLPHAPAQTALAKAALHYVRVGLPVFPLQPQGKAPLVKQGVYAATTNEGQIVSWWRQFPQANIGMPTGQPTNRVVLDVDPRHGGLVSLEQLQQDMQQRATALQRANVNLLATRLQRTGGGGLHLVFGRRADLEMPVRNAVHFAGYRGLDLRGEGGYCVIAPSRHASGEVYQWINNAPLAPFPDLLMDLLRTRQRALDGARFSITLPSKHQSRPSCRADPAYWLDFVLARASIGCRHDCALFLACRLLQEAGLSLAQAAYWLHEYARRVPQGDDPYPVEDALACLRWAATHVV